MPEENLYAASQCPCFHFFPPTILGQTRQTRIQEPWFKWTRSESQEGGIGSCVIVKVDSFQGHIWRVRSESEVGLWISMCSHGNRRLSLTNNTGPGWNGHWSLQSRRELKCCWKNSFPQNIYDNFTCIERASDSDCFAFKKSILLCKI